MTTKDDESAEGCGEKGREFDPTRPERDEEEPAGERPAGGPSGGHPVTHGTPLAPDEYARLKERAKRGGPDDRDGPAQDER